MGKVKVRKYNNSDYVKVESPDGEIYTIYNDIEYLDLRAQIILYKEKGWKVIESNNPEIYKIEEIDINNGYLDGKGTLSTYPFIIHTNLLKLILDIQMNRINISNYLDKTNCYFE